MSTSQETWDDRFMAIARQVAGWSKDPDEGVGAVVVSSDRRQLSVGYNGFPRGSRLDGHDLGKIAKNRLTIHAERNALDNAPFDTRECTVYVTKAPCFDCMLGLVQKGVSRVVYRPMRADSRWAADQRDARALATSHMIECKEVGDA